MWEKKLFTFVNMFLLCKVMVKTFRGAEIRLAAKFFGREYLSRLSVLMLKTWFRDEFRDCFYGGVFGGQKRFHGVQSDHEVAILAGDAYF